MEKGQVFLVHVFPLPSHIFFKFFFAQDVVPGEVNAKGNRSYHNTFPRFCKSEWEDENEEKDEIVAKALDGRPYPCRA